MVRIRIIPATITMAMLLLCVKLVDISRATEALAEQPDAAESAKTADPKSAEGKGEAKTESKGEVKSEAGGEKKSETGEEKKSNPNISDTPGDTVDHRFTPIELDLLQNLVRRREELDHWQKNIEVKEAALDATEKRVNDKISQIEAMKKEVSNLLAQYNEKEDAKIRSLVKIYQSMKPKDAARIFDELDMPILLLVVDKMPEKNTAPILALMDPKKAKQITVQLAEQRKMGTNKAVTEAPPSVGQ